MDDFLTRKALWESQDFQRDAVLKGQVDALATRANIQSRIDDAQMIQGIGNEMNILAGNIWNGVL